MQNTVWKGDHIWVDMRAYKNAPLRLNDVVIVRRQNLLHVRRVCALPGDTIELKHDAVLLNGIAHDERFVIHTQQITDDDPPELHNLPACTIPKNAVFVMGDNRDVSLDSRMADFGFVDRSAIVGKVLFVLRGSSPSKRQGVPVK